MSSSLSIRLASLSASLKSTLGLISELQSLTPATSASPSQRLDLASQIHAQLKEQEDTLSLLRLELDASSSTSKARRQNSTDHLSPDADTLSRLTTSITDARTRFRRAQLTAKRNFDNARRQEREALFHHRKDDGTSTDRPSSQQANGGRDKLTQSDLALSASADVTRALRRTHALLQSNLEQSQFAQQTLDESQSALAGLAESYGGTTDLLKASRGLVSQLVRSNKSDTWYLQTAFYMLAITIAWLVFRRILYGPMWWLVYQPLRLLWYILVTSLGAVGLTGASNVSSAGTLVSSSAVGQNSGTGDIPRNPPGAAFRSMHLPAKGGGWGGPAQPPPMPSPHAEDEESMIEKVGRAVLGEYPQAEEQQPLDEVQHDFHSDGINGQEGERQEEMPRNTKKRMWEEPVRDEL